MCSSCTGVCPGVQRTLTFHAGALGVLSLTGTENAAPCHRARPPSRQDLSPYQAAHQLPYTPSPLAFMSYLFGMGNLLAGPFYEFTDYKQFIELKGVSVVSITGSSHEGEGGGW